MRANSSLEVGVLGLEDPCAELVEAHGGRIWVESDPGKGTAFFVALPSSALPDRLPSGHLHNDRV